MFDARLIAAYQDPLPLYTLGMPSLVIHKGRFSVFHCATSLTLKVSKTLAQWLYSLDGDRLTIINSEDRFQLSESLE